MFSASISTKCPAGTYDLAMARAPLEKSIPTSVPEGPRRRAACIDTAPVPHATSSTESAGLMPAALTSSAVDLKGPLPLLAQSLW